MTETVCIIGHRTIELSDNLEKDITEVICELVKKRKISRFLFGSKSEFDAICYKIITELKKEFCEITRIVYTCKSESIIREEEKERYKKAYYNLCGEKIELAVFDAEVEHKNKNNAGKAGYVERNMAMIDDSAICLVYYNPNYLPPKRKRSKNSLFEYQPKSGTAIAIKYAQKQKKEIINLYKEKGLV